MRDRMNDILKIYKVCSLFEGTHPADTFLYILYDFTLVLKLIYSLFLTIN